MKETDLAYFAGLIDGEGYIGIKKSKPAKDSVSPKFDARIQVRMVDEPAIKFLAETLGGNYYKEKPSVANGRPLFCYQAGGRKCENILRVVRPYLRVKAKNAETVLQFREHQSNRRKYMTRITGYRDLKHWTGKLVRIPNLALSNEYLAECERLYQLCKTLNKVGC